MKFWVLTLFLTWSISLRSADSSSAWSLQPSLPPILSFGIYGDLNFDSTFWNHRFVFFLFLVKFPVRQHAASFTLCAVFYRLESFPSFLLLPDWTSSSTCSVPSQSCLWYLRMTVITLQSNLQLFILQWWYNFNTSQTFSHIGPSGAFIYLVHLQQNFLHHWLLEYFIVVVLIASKTRRQGTQLQIKGITMLGRSVERELNKCVILQSHLLSWKWPCWARARWSWNKEACFLSCS